MKRFLSVFLIFCLSFLAFPIVPVLAFVDVDAPTNLAQKRNSDSSDIPLSGWTNGEVTFSMNKLTSFGSAPTYCDVSIVDIDSHSLVDTFSSGSNWSNNASVTSGFSEGRYRWYANTHEEGGSWVSSDSYFGTTDDDSEMDFGVDTSPPGAITFTEGSGGGGTYTTSDVRFAWDCNDSLSGIDHYEYTTDGGSSWNTTTNAYVDLTLSDGEYHFQVKAFDKAGNETISEDRWFFVNTVSAVPSPPTNLGQYYSDGTPLPPGTWVKYFDEIYLYAEKEPLPVTTSFTAMEQGGGAGWVFDSTDYENYSEGRIPFHTGDNGKYYWQAQTVNGGWPNLSEWIYYPSEGGFAFGIDHTRPEDVIITSGPPDGSTVTTDNVTFEYNSTDATSGIDHYEYSMDFGSTWQDTTEESLTLNSLSNGYYLIYFRAVDKAGNTSWEIPSEFYVDLSPKITVTEDTGIPNGGLTNQNLPRFNFTVNNADNAYYYFGDMDDPLDIEDFDLWSPIPLTNIVEPGPLWNDGSYYLWVKASNKSGDYLDPTIVYQFTYDGTAPTLTATEDHGAVNGNWSNQNNPTFTLNKSESCSATYYCFGTDPSQEPTIPAPTNNIDPGVITTDGTFYLRVKTSDTAGNKTKETLFTYKYDSTNPSGSVNAMASKAYYRGLIPLVSVADDGTGSGIDRVEYYLNGTKLLGVSNTATRYSLLWNSIPLNGSHTISTKIYDNAGNSSVSAVRKIYLDNYKPRTYTGKQSVTAKRNRLVKLPWRVYDRYSGNLARVTLRIQKRFRDGQYRTVTYYRGLTRINNTYEFTRKIRTKGNYRFLVFARDQAGNKQINIAKTYITVK